MTKRMLAMVYTLVALAIGNVAWGQPVSGVDIVTDRPAATLLLPNFVVDVDDPNGKTTMFSINNASATAVLAHVTVWSDLAVPVANFNVYLTGYDVQTINLRDILNGQFPRTASAGQDPGDTISPKGILSQDINFASCTGKLPIANQAPDRVAYMRAALSGAGTNFPTGGAGPLRCFGQNFADTRARGFVTVDTVNNCTLRFPSDVGYFAAGGTGDATNQNVLYGDYLVGRPGSSLGRTLVHIVASATDPETSTPGEYTFYGRLVNWTATDNRQPLSTSFFARYSTSGFGGTVLSVWRDPKVNQQSFVCNTPPAWYPLGQEGIVIFDEQEHSQVPPLCPAGPCPPGPNLAPFGAATQRVAIGGSKLPVPFTAGALFLNLNTTVVGSVNPPEDPAAAQAWVEVLGPEATFNAVRLDSATNASHSTP